MRYCRSSRTRRADALHSHTTTAARGLLRASGCTVPARTAHPLIDWMDTVVVVDDVPEREVASERSIAYVARQIGRMWPTSASRNEGAPSPLKTDEIFGATFAYLVDAVSTVIVLLVPCCIFIVVQAVIALQHPLQNSSIAMYRSVAFVFQWYIMWYILFMIGVWASMTFVPTRAILATPEIGQVPFARSEIVLWLVIWVLWVVMCIYDQANFIPDRASDMIANTVQHVLSSALIAYLPFKCHVQRNVAINRLENCRILADVSKRCFDAIRWAALSWILAIVSLFNPHLTPLILRALSNPPDGLPILTDTVCQEAILGNASYISHHCTRPLGCFWGRGCQARHFAGEGLSWPYTCDDGGYGEYPSTADACIAMADATAATSRQYLMTVAVGGYMLFAIIDCFNLAHPAQAKMPRVVETLSALCMLAIYVLYAVICMQLFFCVMGECDGWLIVNIHGLVISFVCSWLLNFVLRVTARTSLAIWQEVHSGDDDAAFKYDVFLSHAWGNDAAGRDNHARVVAVGEGLREAGLRVWLDQDMMDRDINNQMTEGIDTSRVVAVFVTQTYLSKVAGENGLDDNCKGEFDYAVRRKGVANMIPVVMETGCRDTRSWAGAVGFKLGGQIYHDLSEGDSAPHPAKVAALAQTIQGRDAGPAGAGDSPGHPPSPSISRRLARRLHITSFGVGLGLVLQNEMVSERSRERSPSASRDRGEAREQPAQKAPEAT